VTSLQNPKYHLQVKDLPHVFTVHDSS
jgi:hypothetical protein